MNDIEQVLRRLLRSELEAALANHRCNCSERDPDVQTPYLRTSAAAQYCGVKPQTLYNLKAAGRGPSWRKHGRLTIYLREDLDDWMARQMVSERLAIGTGKSLAE